MILEVGADVNHLGDNVRCYRKTGAFYVALSGLFFGLIGYFGMSIIHAHISVNNMLFWRFLISALFMCFILAFQTISITTRIRAREDNIYGPGQLRKSFATTRMDLFKGAFYGAIFYGPSSTLYFMSANYIGSGLAMVLFYTFPAMVMLFNFLFYKHTISKIYLFAITIMLVGLLFLMRDNPAQFNLMGIGLSLLSALFFACYIIITKNSHAPAQVETLMVCLGSMLSAFIAAQFEHTFFVPQGVELWGNIASIGIICTAVPILLLLKGLKNIGSLQASIISVLEPVFVLIFGVTLLGEVINTSQYIGISVLLFGALLALMSSD